VIQKKIKLCFILSHLPQGGAERQTLNLIQSLDSKVYDITLVLYNREEVFYKEIYDFKIKIIERKYQFKSKIFKTIDSAIFLWFYLRNNDFDILHTLLFHNGFWVRLLAPSTYKNRILYSVRNSLENSPPLFLKFEKKFIKKSFVVTNSFKSRSEFIKLVGNKYSDRVVNIYNGIIIPVIKEKRPKKKIVIGTVGRQTKQKNQIQILRVLKKIRHMYNLSFFLIGDAALDQSKIIQEFIFQNGLEDIVTVMDSQNNIQEYYNQFDIFILSSFYEGCPNVLFEAMVSNVLVVCSSGSNSDNFIENGINGYVYDGTDQDLKAILTQILDTNDLHKINQIKKAGRDFVISNLSRDAMVQNYEMIYLSILKK
jgi:glycosyltransferase involved in cell wall biosynthesis